MGRGNTYNVGGLPCASVAELFRWDVHQDEEFEALPIFHWGNHFTENVKMAIRTGESNSCQSVVAYLGFRVISYSLIPLILNVASTILSLALMILTLPLCLINGKATRYFWTHFQGSVGYTFQSLFDLTCDVRIILGATLGCCCCEKTGQWARV